MQEYYDAIAKHPRFSCARKLATSHTTALNLNRSQIAKMNFAVKSETAQKLRFSLLKKSQNMLL